MPRRCCRSRRRFYHHSFRRRSSSCCRCCRCSIRSCSCSTSSSRWVNRPVRHQDLWKRAYLPKLVGSKSKPHEYASMLALAAAPGKSPVGTPVIHIFGVPPLVMARDLPGISADDGECRVCSEWRRPSGRQEDAAGSASNLCCAAHPRARPRLRALR